MAACAISSTSSSAWCAKRWRSARCCGAWRRTSSGRCDLCCPTMRGCVRLAAPARAVSLRPSRRARNSARHAHSRSAKDEAGRPLKPGQYSVGFEYSDCWVDDARLVMLNARDAAERGARSAPAPRPLPRSARRRMAPYDAGLPPAAARDGAGAILVNAAGPWVADVLAVIGRATRRPASAWSRDPHRRPPALRA